MVSKEVLPSFAGEEVGVGDLLLPKTLVLLESPFVFPVFDATFEGVL
jgi:hypothetical protein